MIIRQICERDLLETAFQWKMQIKNTYSFLAQKDITNGMRQDIDTPTPFHEILFNMRLCRWTRILSNSFIAHWADDYR